MGRRIFEELLGGVNGSGGTHSAVQSFSTLSEPLPFVEEFFKLYPLARELLLASKDRAYFLAISQRPGQKPVSFIPVLDANFEVWFKKVKLLDCISDLYVDSCSFVRIPYRHLKTSKRFSIKTLSVFAFCKYCRQAFESEGRNMKKLLGNIVVERVLDHYYGGNEIR